MFRAETVNLYEFYPCKGIWNSTCLRVCIGIRAFRSKIRYFRMEIRSNSNGSGHSAVRANPLLNGVIHTFDSLIFTVDLAVFRNISSFHKVKLSHFILMQAIFNRMVCVNCKHPRAMESGTQLSMDCGIGYLSTTKPTKT